MRPKHLLIAGITALSLLVTPGGAAVEWSAHGPLILTASTISTAHAAPKPPTPKKPPTNGGPTLTSSGTTAKTTGWQTRPGKGRFTDADCQAVADTIDYYHDKQFEAEAAGNGAGYIHWSNLAQDLASAGMDQGCAFEGIE